jgi:GTP-binding protein EngB required for normal cell division
MFLNYLKIAWRSMKNDRRYVLIKVTIAACLGLVLLDGHSALGMEDLHLLRAMQLLDIPAIILVNKCDLLSEEDIQAVVAYTQKAITEHLGQAPEIAPMTASRIRSRVV